MAENLLIPQNADREQIYISIIPQIESIISSESNQVANLANIAAILKEAFGFFWVGFYLSDGDNELVLGPFQGSLACTRIKKGKGVCGTVFSSGEPLIVPDVDKFPGHIACSSLSRSEVVVPIVKHGKVVGVIDVDSDTLDDFSEIDSKYLMKISEIVAVKVIK